MQQATGKIQKWFWIVSVICAIISFGIFHYSYTSNSQLAKHAEEKLHEKECLAEKKLNELVRNIRKYGSSNAFKYLKKENDDLYEKHDITLCFYKRDTLLFWTANQPAIETLLFSQIHKAELIKLRNGWFESIAKRDSLPSYCAAIALIGIKHQYDVENKYVQNVFSTWLELPNNTNLTLDYTNQNNIITSKEGNTLFAITREGSSSVNQYMMMLSSLFALLSFAGALIAIYHIMLVQVQNKFIRFIAYTFIVFALRTLMIYYKFPQSFYQTSLFNPIIFADGSSFYFSHLGDILINSILLFIISVIAFKTNLTKHFSSNTKIVLFMCGATLLQFLYSTVIKNTIQSLVNNSTITYNINDLFNLSYYTFIGLLSVGLMLYSFYIFTEKLVVVAFLLKKKILISLLLSMGLITVICFYSNSNVLECLWTLPLVGLSVLLKKYKASYNFINVGLIILTSTIAISLLFNKYERINKKSTYDALSYSLTDRQEVIAENEFIKVATSIKSDERLKNLLSLMPLSAQATEQNIRQTNFSGYFERYDIHLYLVKDHCSFSLPQDENEYLTETAFEEEILKGSQTVSDELRFIDDENGPIKYIAKLELKDRAEKNYQLYIRLDPKNSSYLGVFPDLLLDKSLEKKRDLKNISYAIYYNHKLQQSYGDFQYPLFYSNNFFENSLSENYEHYSYETRNNTELIISDARFGLWQHLTSISYLFIFFTLIVLLSIWVNNFINKKQNKFTSLNYRIQFVLVSVVFISLATVVTGTIWVVNSQFENNNKNELISKSKLVLNEVQQYVGKTGKLELSSKDATTAMLKKLAKLFDSDISMFTDKGALYASSQSAIYDQGLISKFINPTAFSHFNQNALTAYSHRENIGSLNYLSAYMPFFNQNSQLVGFINLPYFSRQKDLEKELIVYLTTLINIYTILFVIATLISLFLSTILTKPLRMIKQQLSGLKFGAKNEEIQWQSDDEIGGLVSEYNGMLVKLDESSKLLAKSERESAWREMAKQVAHEIKNPLTPMKLNIQHLKRVVATNPEDINERVTKVADMLIEQIDSLSFIATEFSNFAKLPNTQLVKLNVVEVLQNVAELFQQNNHIKILLHAPKSLLIMADREQCVRLFTNLLKNAEQSIPETKEGIIEISAWEEKGNQLIISIKDNGTGIEDDIKEKIFEPNFTTKSTGAGLGLAMVKNSVTAFNGTITFETVINKGTTFTLIFPLLTD